MTLAEDPAAAWTAALLAVPLAAAALTFLLGRRVVPWLPIVAGAVLVVAAAAVLVQLDAVGPWRYPVGGWTAPLGIEWRVDAVSGLLLMLTAVVGLTVAVHAAGEFERAGVQSRLLGFWPLLLLLWTALNALFLSADVFNLYVCLELTTLAAVALATLQGTGQALEAGMRYLLYALFASMSYLLGVALLYGGFGVLDLYLLAERIEPSPAAYAALGLMTAGLFAKTALFPLHGWLPPAHGSAPGPASALLSGLVVTAGAYLLIRLLLEPFAPLLSFGARQLLGALGAAAVLWGSLLALQQSRIKRVVAYSTVAQLGYLLLVVPLGAAAVPGVIVLAAAHGMAKAAMFLAAGLVLHALGHDRLSRLQGAAVALPVPFFTMGLAGLTLMGLPPSGGFVAKWLLLRVALERGQWWWALVLLIGGLLAAAYVFRLLTRGLREGRQPRVEAPPAWLQWTCLALALGSVLLGLWPLPVVELLREAVA